MGDAALCRADMQQTLADEEISMVSYNKVPRMERVPLYASFLQHVRMRNTSGTNHDPTGNFPRAYSH